MLLLVAALLIGILVGISVFSTPENADPARTIKSPNTDLESIYEDSINAKNAAINDLIEEMNSTRGSLRQTLNTERSAQLTTLAEKYGIENEKDVNRFIKDTQRTLKSPVFRYNSNRIGGSRGRDRYLSPAGINNRHLPCCMYQSVAVI